MQLPTVTEPALDLLSAEVIATWPTGTFLENLAFAPDGDLFVTDYHGGTVFRVDPEGGTPEAVCSPGVHPLGIAFEPDGSALLSAHRQLGFDERPRGAFDSFWRLDPDGNAELVAEAPGARFLNGLTRIAPGRFACADSSGLLWEIDAAAGRAEIVSRSELIGPIDPADPLPAANGIKPQGDHVYISNWVRAQLVRVPLDDLATPEIVNEDVIIDDFAFAQDGSLFGATHLATVIRLEPDGTRYTVAGPEQHVAGCTACAFRPGSDALYVITDGGTVAGTPEPARLVVLKTGRPGAALL
jgi:sugar lactone lactonase YvrE